MSTDTRAPEETTTPATAPKRPRRRPSGVRKALIGLFACVLLLVLGGVGTGLYLQHRLSANLHRIPDVFSGLDNRPSKPSSGAAAKAVNILLMGTDRRSEAPTTGTDARAPAWVPGAQRTDTLMVLHIAGDRRSASVISIPRDSWVKIPGHGSAKINAGFSYGGPSLAVATVEKLTNVHIDHLAVIDWDGFKALTDAVGGVTIDIPKTVHDSARDITWTQGRHKLNGQQALNYVGERYGLPGGDFDRIHRQQYFLQQLMQDTLHAEMRKEPRAVFHVLDLVSHHLSVDDGWTGGDLRNLAFSLRSLRSASIDYLTVPVRGTGRVGAASVVFLDNAGNKTLWKSVRDDQLGDWVAANPDSEVPESVR